MKLLFFFLMSVALLFSACGGVIGNIEKYRFDNISKHQLKAIVNDIYINHPELKEFDTVRYQEGESGFGDGDYYCTIVTNSKKYLCCYAYVQYESPNDTVVEIALTTAAPYGDNLYLAKNIKRSDQKKYRKLFVEHFINKIEAKLGTKATIK